MENQHRKIKGYRELSQAEIDLMNEIKQKGVELGASHCLTDKDFFDCKRATLHGEYVITIADAFLDIIDTLQDSPTAVSGPTIGADPLITAITMRASQTGRACVNGVIIRKEPKKHGSKNYIENDQGPGTRVVVVDDVITTGISIVKACDHLLAAGYHISAIIAVIDRGGAEDLRGYYDCGVYSLFKVSDFT